MSPDALAAVLVSARNPDGGWGYRAGKQSRVEPTSFALVALSAAGEGAGGAAVTADALARFPRRDGLLMDPGATHPNVAFSGIAALAAQYAPLGGRELAGSLAEALLAQRGRTLRPSQQIVQDNSLVGWAWVDGTFSWVEPTAWCRLALKRWGGPGATGDLAARVDEAGRLLRDRMCEGGGWNYGNRLVLEKKLRPYASTTAVALLALQDTPDDPVVRQSRAALVRLAAREQSGYALALSCLAFARLGAPEPAVEEALARGWDETRFGGEVVATALALYVVAGRERRHEAFGVRSADGADAATRSADGADARFTGGLVSADPRVRPEC